MKKIFNVLSKKIMNQENKGSVEVNRIDENDTIQNVWNVVAKRFDCYCTKTLLSDAFKYLAALRLFNFDMTIETISNMTGCTKISDLENALENVSENGIRIKEDKRIHLSYRKLLSDYYVNDVTSYKEEIQKCLIEVAESNYMSEEQVMNFEKFVCSKENLMRKKRKSEIIDCELVIEKFFENEYYKSIVKEQDRYESLEMAYEMSKINQLNSEMPDYIQNRDAILEKAFFEKKERYTNLGDSFKTTLAWIKYFNIIACYMDYLPKEFIDYVTLDTYRKITKLIDNFKSGTTSIEMEKWQRENIYKLSEQVYLKIITDIDESDGPANFGLCDIYISRSEYSTARSALYRISEDSCNSYAIGTKLINCYEREIKDLLNAKHETSEMLTASDYRTIRDINQRINDLYTDWINKASVGIRNGAEMESERSKKAYVTLIANYARHEKERGNYSKSQSILKQVPEDYPEMFRVYNEFAMLYQTKGKKNSNSLHDFSKAECYFKKALQSMESAFSNSTAWKSIMMPLANTLFQMGKCEEAENVCEQILELFPTEKNAKSLLLKIKKVGTTELATA